MNKKGYTLIQNSPYFDSDIRDLINAQILRGKNTAIEIGVNGSIEKYISSFLEELKEILIKQQSFYGLLKNYFYMCDANLNDNIILLDCMEHRHPLYGFTVEKTTMEISFSTSHDNLIYFFRKIYIEKSKEMTREQMIDKAKRIEEDSLHYTFKHLCSGNQWTIYAEYHSLMCDARYFYHDKLAKMTDEKAIQELDYLTYRREGLNKLYNKYEFPRWTSKIPKGDIFHENSFLKELYQDILTKYHEYYRYRPSKMKKDKNIKNRIDKLDDRDNKEILLKIIKGCK